MPFHVVAEGHGEPAALENLLNRLQRDLGLPSAVWRTPRRMSVLTPAKARRAAELARAEGDVQGLLLTRDDEDGCPRESAPELARWLKEMELPFPAAVVLFYREYETMFLPCVEEMAGRPIREGNLERPGLVAGAQYDGNYEAPRDAKGELTALMPSGRSYKPTTDQLAFTRMLDFDRLRASGLPCFGTLERALRFLLGEARPGSVFPIDR